MKNFTLADIQLKHKLIGAAVILAIISFIASAFLIGTFVKSEVIKIITKQYQLFTNVATTADFSSSIDTQVLDTHIKKIVSNTSMLFALTIAILLVIITLLCSHVFNKFNALVANCISFGEGDLSIEINADLTKRKDEIGQMANILETMRQRLNNILTQIQTNSDELLDISSHLQNSVTSSNNEMANIVNQVEYLLSGSEIQVQLTSTNTTMTQEIHNGMENMALTVQNISGSAVNTLNAARGGEENLKHMVDQMNVINEKVAETSNCIDLLSQKSNEIEEAIKLITDVTAQTNLLALNASIEAARAGEHGKGFAVVAEQVSKLADESKTAAAKIEEMISEIRAGVDASVGAIHDGTYAVEQGIKLAISTEQNFESIVLEIGRVSDEICHVSAVTEEVTGGTTTIYEDISHIADITEKATTAIKNVSKSTQEQEKELKEISSHTDLLELVSSTLSSSVNQFKLHNENNK